MSTRNGSRAVARAASFWLGTSLALAAGGAAAATPALEEARLVRLVRHDCGSCHGLTLNGGLGPALTPGALAGKPADYVREMILHGRNGTAMPPWAPFLSHAEADWIARRLLTGFPDAR